MKIFQLATSLLLVLFHKASCQHPATETIFPRATDVVADRPRLLLTETDLERLRADYSAGNEPVLRWVETLTLHAEKLLDEPPVQFPGPENDILDQSREVMRRVYTLAFLQRWTGDSRFGNRLWAELESAAAQQSWRAHIQFLTAAEMLHGFAIAYDWLHHFWDVQQRHILAQAILKKGLEAGRAAYDGELPGYAGWNSDNNWNLVCNSALVVGALAVLPEETELCEKILRGAFERLPRAIAKYGTDGGWAEGLTYWSYATSYFATLLTALDSATGQDYGLASLSPGLAHTGWFPIYLTSPTGGIFNFADSERKLPASHALIDLGSRFSQPEWIDYQLRHGSASAANLAAWGRHIGRPAMQTPSEKPPLDRIFSDAGLISFRSGWGDSGAAWVAMKVGYNGANHGHLDLGSFVFEALGHRWVHELDKESYSLPGFFEMGEGGRRWNYYAVRAEGHNTLVIHPAEKADQFARAKSRILSHHCGPAEALAVVDLTDAYLPRARRVLRGIRLTDSRSRLFVQDEVTPARPGEIIWSVHVKDKVQLSPDARQAVLEADTARLVITLDSPAEARFEVLPAAPLVKIPKTRQRPNPEFKKIAIRVTTESPVVFAVWFEPHPLQVEAPYALRGSFGALADWKPDERAACLLQSVKIDGRELPGFLPEIFTQEFTCKGDVKLTAFPEDVLVKSVVTKDVENLTTYYLRVHSEDTLPSLYQIRLRPPPVAPATLQALPERLKYRAHGSSDEGHGPQNVLDGSLATRWSALGTDAVLDIDLGVEPLTLRAVAIAFHSGDARRTTFSLEISEDGSHYREILPATKSSGRTTLPEVFELPQPATGVRLRIQGYGNSQNEWTSLTEVVPLSELP